MILSKYNFGILALVFIIILSIMALSGCNSTNPAAATPTPAGAPSAPTGVTATASGTTQINLTWTLNASATSYNIYRSTTTGFTIALANKIASTASASYSNTGLTAATTYYYKITAVNANGESAPSAEASASTAVGILSAPTGVAAAASTTQNVITWSPVTGAAYYNIYWANASGVTQLTGTKIASATSPYNHTGIANNLIYYYVVTAVNAVGTESADSAQVIATGAGTGLGGLGKGPAPLNLASAGTYVILAKSAISTVPTSAITGNLGLSPAAASFITGFSLVADASNVFSTSSQVTGQVFAADYAPPTPANLTTTITEMQNAYTDAAGRAPDFTDLGAGSIGGMTLPPGTYKWTTALTIPTSVTLSGGPNDVWIFQVAQGITQAAATNVILSGGALPKNVFWQAAGAVSLGTTAHMEGVILSQTSITLGTGATANSRLMAQTSVILNANTLTQPAP